MHRTHGNYGFTNQGMQLQSGNQWGSNWGQTGHHTGSQFGTQMGQSAYQTGHTGQHQGYQSTNMGYQSGGQMGQVTGQQTGQMGQQTGQMGQQTGQMGQQTGQMGQQMSKKFGAGELLGAHEVLCDHIDGINQFELYRPYVKEQKLMQILDNQVNHMYNSYQNLVNYLHNQGMGSAIPYRVPKASPVKYGLRQPSPAEPNTSENQMDDRDVASGMMGCAKSSAWLCTTVALECADANLRTMMTNCAVSSINQAYEVFQYMNQKGMYQVPTLADQTTQTMINTYQAGSQPHFQ